MIGPTIALLRSLPCDLPFHEALSGIAGSISLATWMWVSFPQLWLNYKNGSAEGLSMAFLLIWLIGDVTNLLGALWAGLVPTVIATAAYFCLSDGVLILQCFYYNEWARKREEKPTDPETHSATEESPLIRQTLRRQTSAGLPGANRRLSNLSETGPSFLDGFVEAEDGKKSQSEWLHSVIQITLVILVGFSGWSVALLTGAWKPGLDGAVDLPGNEIAWGAQVLGYISAVAYLGARLPQIYKNYKNKSCEGTAILFFILSTMGNVTYGVGILAHSLEKQYLLENAPWLIGSLGTVLQDIVIMWQFRLYAKKDVTSGSDAS